MTYKKYFLYASSYVFCGFIFLGTVYGGTLTCTTINVAACPITSTTTRVLNLSALTGGHAELPSQSNYAKAVCCSGVNGIGNSCGANSVIIGYVSSTSNSHVNPTSSGSFTTPFCISYATGSQIVIGNISAGTCSSAGYDTTLMSVSSTSGGHIGQSSAYSYKVCGTGYDQYLSFSISTNAIGFGTLSSSAASYASSDLLGTSSPSTAHTIAVVTNALSGYAMTVQGQTLTNGRGDTINVCATSSAATITTGIEQFGLSATSSGGTGNLVARYSQGTTKCSYGATATTTDTVATESVGDNATTTYSIGYVANIASTTETGAYSASLIYTVTAGY